MLKAIGNDAEYVPELPLPLLNTDSDIVDSRAHVCWPSNRAVSSDNPRGVIKCSAGP